MIKVPPVTLHLNTLIDKWKTKYLKKHWPYGVKPWQIESLTEGKPGREYMS